MARQTTLACCFFVIVVFNNSIASMAQSFQDVTDSLGIAGLNATTMYGCGASFFDVNEDGWDDLTIGIAGAPTRLYMNQNGSFTLYAAFENIYDTKTCLWGDYDEDGDNDLFIVKRDGPSQLYIQTDSLVFQNNSSLLNTPYVSNSNPFGAALGDYNRDSYLDLCIANYGNHINGGVKNRLLTNNQLGSFVPTLIGYNRAHFQPVFIDLYRDLFQDLFVIVDFKFRSEYFTQNSSGVFFDETPTGGYGLSVEIDAMSNSWCDFDNDGHLDLYLTNTPTDGNFLMRNDGQNNFQNVAALTGSVLNKWTWSGLWIDIENDGWSDLIVNERNVNLSLPTQFGIHLLHNTEGFFQEMEDQTLTYLQNGFFTSSKGDFNNDGLYDLYLGAETGFQSRVFQNTSSAVNNFVKCRLKGRLSNRNGVGTHIDYYVNGEHRIHYTQSGENYLNQNSQNLIFGLGQSTVIDSLKLSWLSGIVDTYYNIPANTTHVFVEGETMPNIQASKAFLCSNGNDSLALSISGWPLHTWNNGSTSNSIWVYTPGEYTVSVETGYGHAITLTYTVEFASAEFFEVNTTPVLCFGDSNGAIQVTNGLTGEMVYNQYELPAGSHTFPLTLSEGCIIEQHVVIDQPMPFTVNVNSIQSTCFGVSTGSVIIQGTEGTPPYDGFSETGFLHVQNLTAGMYIDSVYDANGCQANVTWEIEEIAPPELDAIVNFESVFGLGSISLHVSGDHSPYAVNWQTGFEGLIYDSLSQGVYSVSVIDSFGCALDTSFTVLFDFVEEERATSVFFMDWKSKELTFVGTERLFDVEIFNALGQIIHRQTSIGPGEAVELDISLQIIYISTSKGSYRAKLILK
jgi:hypothetical protein